MRVSTNLWQNQHFAIATRPPEVIATESRRITSGHYARRFPGCQAVSTPIIRFFIGIRKTGKICMKPGKNAVSPTHPPRNPGYSGRNFLKMQREPLS
jgi:hypothetical protein